MSNNDMTGGCSGGPWITTYQGSGNYANGINVCDGSGGSTTEASPYFGDFNFKGLLDFINAHHP